MLAHTFKWSTYIEGTESIPDLAKVFDLSNARIHQIIHYQ